ncbi:MAG: TonB-dependent receptor, partial [Bacteroidales bacterium]|nr:TonB-dependent receptor [Bacteroidales bacterium]
PSVSAGWTVSNEPFMQNVKDATGLTFMKFRASWGINGNVNAMGSYQYKGTLNSGAANGYNFYETGSRVIGVGPGGVFPNPKIKWETSRQLDLGLDLRFFKERLNVTIDWYTKNTNDLITSTEAPYHTGSSTMYINAGKINNHGTEIEVGWKDNIGDFSYSINGNLATLHNKVLEGLSAGRINGQRIWGSQYITYFEEGYPLWYIRLWEIDHIDQETGAAVYKQHDDNPAINDSDRVFAGSGIPDLTYGITINLAYKGFDFVAYGTGAQGVERFFAMTRGDNFSANTLKEFYTKAWQSPSSTGYIHPKPSNRDRYIVASTDRLFDASFFKIKQLQLGYTIPRSVASKIKLSNCRVYVSLDDWFTFTKYPGLDPEVSHFSQSSSGLGIDYGSYPISKKLVFGLNVSF